MVSFRYLAHNITIDATYEYLKMYERTPHECIDYFLHICFFLVFGKKYLCKPTRRNIEKFYLAHEAKHGLPVMICSLDCTHWRRKLFKCVTRVSTIMYACIILHSTIVE